MWRPLLQNLARCSCVAMLFLCAKRSSAQTVTVNPHDSVYHWQIVKQADRDLFLESEYAGLPNADYTPPVSIRTWKAAGALAHLAQSLGQNVSFSGKYVLLVSSQGIIRQVKTRTATDKGISASIVRLLVGSKTNGQSFLRNNKAVPSFEPCTITIENQKIAVL
jgi:hypothetical protein